MKDVASIIRSKNAGPFEITFDILFDDIATFERVRASDVLRNEVIMKLYNIKDEETIVTNMYFEAALGWKCTIIRPKGSEQGRLVLDLYRVCDIILIDDCSIGERDTFGTQQHAPLLDIEVPAVN